MKRKISLKACVHTGLTAAFAVWIVYMVWPLISIAQYTHSTTDDYWMSLSVHKVWEATHSIFAAFWEAVKITVSQWLYHDGCFISMLMMALSPVAFNEKYYKFTAYFVLFTLIAAVYFASYVFFRKKLEFSWMASTVMGSIILFLLVCYVPSPGEGFYWWPGGANYTFFFSLFLVLQSFVVMYMTQKKTVWLVLSCIFAAVGCQGNLLTALSGTCVLFLEMLYLFKRDGAKKNGMILVFLLSVVSMLVSVLAPGNFIRGAEDIGKNNFFMTVILAVKNGSVFFAAFHRKGGLVYYLFLAVVSLYAFLHSKVSFRFRYPLLFCAAAYLVYCSSMAPVEFTGIPYYARVQDLIYYNVVTVSSVCIVYLTGYLSVFLKKAMDKEGRPVVERAGNVSVFVLAGFGALLLAFSLTHPFGTTSFAAKTHLGNMDAQLFDKRINDRFVSFYDDNVRIVEFECENNVPSVFFFNDVDTMNQKAFFIENGTRIVADYFYLEDKNAVFEELKYMNLLTYYFDKDEIIMHR